MIKSIPGIQLLSVFIIAGSLLAPFFPAVELLPSAAPEVPEVKVQSFPEYYAPALNDGYYLQGYNQCAGYSTAFVQRFYNQHALGSENYRQLSYPLPFDIGVPPHRILRHLRSNQLNASARIGNLDNLKYHLSRGIPVIVMVGDGLKWQHYMVAIGYNNLKDEIYFYDPETGPSLLPRQEPGNLTLDTDKFLDIWENNLPFFSQMFITVEPREIPQET